MGKRDDNERARAGGLPPDPFADTDPVDPPGAEEPPPWDDVPPPDGPDAWGREERRGTGAEEPREREAERVAGMAWTCPGPDWVFEKPPNRSYLLHDKGDAVSLGAGMLPRGKVALLAAAGGVGKTFALVGLALAVATGRDWLGYFPVGPGGSRRVVLVLGEEDPAEVRRRVWEQARVMGLSDLPAERLAEALAGILVLPGAGLDALALTRAEEPGARAPKPRTPFADGLFDHLERLAKEAGAGWDAVILDPLSRFAGPDVEVDNSAATRLVQVLERFTKLPGEPTVIVAHHTTKASRSADGGGASAVAVRGSSALTDGARWVAGLDPVELPMNAVLPGHARFRVTKNNYGRFPTFPDGALLLTRDGGGLRVATSQEGAALRTAELDAVKAAGAKDGENRAVHAAARKEAAKTRDPGA